MLKNGRASVSAVIREKRSPLKISPLKSNKQYDDAARIFFPSKVIKLRYRGRIALNSQ